MIECNLQKQKINERKFTMEKLFKLKEHGTDVKTEIIAGITTFLAMVKMFNFVTKSSCQEFLTCDFKPLTVPVLCFYGYDIRSCNLAEHSGYAKTAFAAGLFSAFFYYFRVYKFNFTATNESVSILLLKLYLF